MSNFSERYGFTQRAMQIGGMNEALRNRIWNFITEPIDFAPDAGPWRTLLTVLADEFFKVPTDSVPEYDGSRGRNWLREKYARLTWYETYDLLEFTVAWAELFTLGKYTLEKRAPEANRILEREMSGYRFVNGEIAEITNELEIQAIEEAMSASSNAELDEVRTHLETALKRFSQKPDPDYRNSIKESISAVESAAKLISGVSSRGLDDALKALGRQIPIHAALKQGFLNLYGYTSDAGGIRHALIDEPNVGFDEAKYMLVTCSAFTTYLISKNADRLRSNLG